MGADDSVNVWVIVLPLTGIILVVIFTIMCICRNTCRFISVISKQCEKRMTSHDKVVKVALPSPAHINEVMISLSPRIEHRGVPTGAAFTATKDVEEPVPSKGQQRLSTVVDVEVETESLLENNNNCKRTNTLSPSIQLLNIPASQDEGPQKV